MAHLLKGFTYKEGNLPLFRSCLEEVFSAIGLPAYLVLGNPQAAFTPVTVSGGSVVR